MQERGWLLRSDIIWAKANPLPESVRDRPTRSHEHIFLFTKGPVYWYDAEAIAEPCAEHTLTAYPNGPGGYYALNVPGQSPQRGLAKQQIPQKGRTGRTAFRGQGHMREGENGPANREGRDMRNVGAPGLRKQDQVGKRTYTGFNDRWDEQDGQHAVTRNSRDVWHINPKPFTDWIESVLRVPVAPGDADDGTKRTTSPDCPVHGFLEEPGSSHACGERGDGGRCHTDSSGAHRVPEPPADCGSTVLPLGPDLPERSSDSPALSYVPSATGHSTETRRMDLALETSPACTPCAQTASRTGDRSEEPACAERDQRTCANNTEADSSAGDSERSPSAGTLDDMTGTASLAPPECTCSLYREERAKSSHFAVFPDELPRRAIRAGCPLLVCAECGVPWVREVEVKREPRGDAFGCREPGAGLDHGQAGSGYQEVKDRTPGPWHPACKCIDAGSEPGLVLDPFTGSGTTGIVAVREGRRFLGFELNPEYVEMARWRIDRALAVEKRPPKQPDPEVQEALF